MRTEQTEFEGAVAVVRTRAVRTTLIENKYTEILSKAYPEVISLRRESLTVSLPKQLRVVSKDGTVSVEDEPTDKVRYLLELERVIRQFPLANEIMTRIQDFVILAARIVSLTGTDFNVVDGSFDSKLLVIAFENFLDSDSYNSGLWGQIFATIVELNKSSTPVEQQPVEALTTEELNDPLLVELISSGKMELVTRYLKTQDLEPLMLKQLSLIGVSDLTTING